ncbi:aminotransferase class V-fold PLP-dependent enzyme [Streptomyces sp. HB2AG]|uniref:aminotransferase class V-fold PLP-dependent enzyme n=1 Tax=Streptomyces sp. HB2AG TaxID=2983400 RepID=UPI0022AAC9E5|nr:aminotransferase class V-fold PLP-dependent enzyme [Streptomyces sp. HB2AG]MCZ2523496.1 aminotransferase class V-fold PLP-dependent enzyme [Streptomyces sp. HB2AG]
MTETTGTREGSAGNAPGGNPLWGDDWPQVRALWSLDETVLHLNHGSFGGVPAAVREEQDRLRAEAENSPDAWFRRLPARIAAARTELAGVCGAPVEAFSLVLNASAGTTSALASLPLREGSHLLLTDHAYGAAAMAAARFARARGASVRRLEVPLDAPAEQVLRLLEEAVDERTGAVLMDQVSSATARTFPVAGAAAVCRERGVPLLVDGAHAPGMLDGPADCGADFWVGNLHKWACAPRGTAGFAVSAEHRGRVRGPIASWGEEEPYPAAFDQQGTWDATGWLTAPLSAALLEGLGWERVRAHNAALAEYGQAVVCEALGTAPARVADPAPSMRLVPLPPGTAGTFEAARALQCALVERAGCETAVTTWNGRGFLRVSAQVYNRPGEYEVLARGLREVLS